MLQQLHGAVIVDMQPSAPNPDRAQGANRGSGWPGTLIVTVKQSSKTAGSAGSRDPRAVQLVQQQQPAALTEQASAQQQGQLESTQKLQPEQARAQQQQQEQQHAQPESTQQQPEVWQQQQQLVVAQPHQPLQEQQPWLVNSSTGGTSTDSFAYVHVALDGQQYIVQQPPTLMVPLSQSDMQAMNASLQGLQAVSVQHGGVLLPAAAAGYPHSTQPCLVGVVEPGVQVAATASVTSAPTGEDQQQLAAAAAAGQSAGETPEVHAGVSGKDAAGLPWHSAVAVAAGGQTGTDEAAGALPAAAAAAMPALPAAPASNIMTDEIMDAVVDLATLLNKEHDPSLDIGCCAEVLYELSEDPAAARKFMRVAFSALCSAVRLNNPAGAVSIIKRYLQKATP